MLEFAADYDGGAIARVMNNVLYRYLKRGTIDRALVLMPRALSYAEKNPAILHNAACLLVRAGQLDRALACVKEARRYNYDKLSANQADDDLAPLRDLPGFAEMFAK